MSSVFHGGTGFGRVRYVPGGRCGPRKQNAWQLVVVESGSCRLQVGSRKLQIRAGQGILLAPGPFELFVFDSVHPTMHSWATAEKLPMPHPARTNCWRVGPASSRLRDLINLGLQPGSGNSSPDAPRLRALISAAVWEFADGLQAESGSSSMDALARARRCVEEHLSGSLSLDVLAKEAGLSRTPLRKLFLKAEGITPMRYVRMRRLQKAAGLIEGSGMKLSAVAESCGFANEFHLSRLFKAEFGLPPRDWRGRNRKE